MGCLLRLSFIIIIFFFFSFCLSSSPYDTITPDQQTTKVYSGPSTVGLVLFVVGLVILLIVLSIGVWWCFRCIQLRMTTTTTPPTDMEMSTSIEPGRTFTFQELEVATNSFGPENELGSGGFGVVYKGRLSNGTLVAVKRVHTAHNTPSHGLKEFEVELKFLIKIRHRNIVSFLGYCIHLEHRLLVLEYVPNGTLTQHLFPPNGNDSLLTWKQRVRIALDVALGLEYLHNGILMSAQFIHRDIQPNNILLDDQMRAKVANFGLVLITRKINPVYVSRFARTVGYTSPEYAKSGKVTTKLDVYAFGIILLELLTGRRAIDESVSRHKIHLGLWLQDPQEVIPVDTKIDQSDEKVRQSVIAVSDLAVQCINLDLDNRPEMQDVVHVLSKILDTLETAPHGDQSTTASTTDFFYDCPASDEITEEWEPEEAGTSRLITDTLYFSIS
ncbi:hypothetical protein QVD17_09880 [Tagetes erecta]|uniref:Protein kinase domain-containing protein n=1 Tax=Tagetes erecta TaxID=13708 RepID=A0AAD8P5P9_TARER|nr:hypothetical protein QVD17_09880 [Tagetes erecta]